jgi:hypothetical protein
MAETETPAHDEDQQPSPASKKRRKRRRRLFMAVRLFLIYTAYCALLYFWQDALIFPADKAPAAPPNLIWASAAAERMDLEIAPDTHVEGWFFPARGASPDAPAPVVFYFHGNAEIIDQLNDVVREYNEIGCSVFLQEYRGYGRSPGKPSQQNLTQDAVAFHDLVIARPDVDPERVVYDGRSLGGAIAIQLARHRQPQAMILQSTLASMGAMAHKYFVPAFMLRHPFRSEQIIRNLEMPILITHGRRDQIIPVSHGRRLHEAAPNSEYLETDAGHNNMPGVLGDPAWWKHVERFLDAADIIETVEQES